jgi:glutamate-5-semialdehyde dehydrogenase
MTALERSAALVKRASRAAAALSPGEKAKILNAAALSIENNIDNILSENAKDVEAAKAAGVKAAFMDRLVLGPARVKSMAEGIRNVASLPDPLSGFDETRKLPNGLILSKKRVPLGVVAVIFESRPNVSADSFAICFKAGNGVILRGGKESVRSNNAVAGAIRAAVKESGFDENIIFCLADTSRETAGELMRLNKYVDVLVPRGGAGLISSVIQNSTVPAIQTGVGNCHIYVDESFNIGDAVGIIVNAKTQRPGVCNAAEKLLVHRGAARAFIPVIAEALREKGVELRGDEESREIDPSITPAARDDWETEYEDLIMAIAVVPDISAAIGHIAEYGSGHSEAIITADYKNALRFTGEVDAAAVYVNASTRFTDGGEFGLGAEIGISTQKLHARGPMGVREMTTAKYVILGDGHVRS